MSIRAFSEALEPNPMRSPSRLVHAALLILGTFAGGVAQAQPGISPRCADPVTILRGDTLSRIAQRCDVSEAAVLAANPDIHDSGDLEVGAPVRLGPVTTKGGAALGAAAGQIGDWAARTGKSLEGFAGDVGTSLDGLLARNPALRGQLRQLGIPDLARPSPTPAVAIFPDRGPPGTSVAVSAIGLPPGTRVTIGAGPPRTAYEAIGSAITSGDGTFDTTVAMPGWSAAAGSVLVVVTSRDPAIRVRSAPFAVTPAAPLPLNPR